MLFLRGHVSMAPVLGLLSARELKQTTSKAVNCGDSRFCSIFNICHYAVYADTFHTDMRLKQLIE